MLLIVCTWHTVALKYSLNRYIIIYEKSTVQFASVGLAQACPNEGGAQCTSELGHDQEKKNILMRILFAGVEREN